MSEQLSQISSLSSNYRRASISNSEQSGSSRGGPRMSPTHKVSSPSKRLKKSTEKGKYSKRYMQNMSGIIQEVLDDASSDEQN